MHTPPTANPSQLSERVASEIRAEMARRGITQSTLAERLGEHQPWVSRRINPTRRAPISVDDLERIARVLDVSADDLVKRALGAAVPA